MLAVVSCATPAAGDNSYVSGSDFVYEDTATYQCNHGYEADTGDVTRSCQADASWSGTPLNCRRRYMPVLFCPSEYRK